MKDTAAIVIRAIMKTFAGWLVAKALADKETADMVANGIGAGLLILFCLIWSHVHLFRVSNPLSSPKGLGLLFAGLVIASVALTGCTTALQSNKLISVKQRCFGLVIETTSAAANTPNVKLGFVSTVWQMIPTSTNAIYAPNYMDTFDLSQGLNPFSTGITENTGAGSVMIGTNGEASAFAPK